MAEVLVPFRDKFTWRSYAAGDEFVGSDERIRELVKGGYVKSGPVAHSAGEKPSGAPTVAQGGTLDGLTVAELRKLAEERGIDVPKRAGKDRLLEILGA